MRIAMLGWEFPPYNSGGLGVHCYELSRKLANLGVEIDFFMPAVGECEVQHYPNLRIIQVCKTELQPYYHYLKSQKPGIAKKIKFDRVTDAAYVYNRMLEDMVAAYHKERHYSLLHGHDWLTVQGGIALKYRLGIPLVQTFHSTEYDRTSNPFEYIVGIEKAGLYHADRVITVSRRTKHRLVAMGCPEYKIRVIYNGVDWEKFAKNSMLSSHSAQRTGKQPYFQRKRKIVLFLGRITEQKGPVNFLLAAKRVVEKYPDVLFLIAGTGDLLPTMINLSISLGLASNVMFLGRISDADSRRIYAIADLYVMPSMSEPFGITALEALSSATPILISKTSGVSEVVRTAIKVDFWDIDGMASKMISLLKFDTLRKVMSNHGNREARKLTWDKTAQSTLMVYHELMGFGHGD